MHDIWNLWHGTDEGVVEELRGSAPQFASIGNCVKPDTITFAVYQGYHAALDIH